jgi:uncharacterized protein (UPF0333 family)
MRGQVSLEFLILFGLFLSMLVIAFGAITRIGKMGEREIEKRSAELLADDISNAVNNVCILGDGNREEIESGTGFSISPQENGFLLKVGNAEIRKSAVCEVIVDGDAFSGRINVENKDGKVRIS